MLCAVSTREPIDHMLVHNEQHLQHALNQYRNTSTTRDRTSGSTNADRANLPGSRAERRGPCLPPSSLDHDYRAAA
jgi:hypothetical protein